MTQSERTGRALILNDDRQVLDVPVKIAPQGLIELGPMSFDTAQFLQMSGVRRTLHFYEGLDEMPGGNLPDPTLTADVHTSSVVKLQDGQALVEMMFS